MNVATFRNIITTRNKSTVDDIDLYYDPNPNLAT